MPERRAAMPRALALALLALPVPGGVAGAAEGGAVAGARAAELEHILIQDCGSCHGLTLKGGLGRPLTPDALAGWADTDTLTGIILDGMPGTAMPPWRPLLTEEEAMWIARYLKQD